MILRPTGQDPNRTLALKLMASAAALALLSACAKSDGQRALLGGASTLQNPASTSRQAAQEPNNPLHRATAYWARQHEKSPQDADAALNYALNLKALGATARALQVLEVAHRHNSSDARIASEYGRLALAADNLKLAERLLSQAEQATRRPDWRLLSAQGALHAKQGDNDTAKRYFRAALKQNPNSTSTMNNLAMSYVLDGQADQAESLLRKAMAQSNDNPRLRQNLALVIGLQGRFEESQQVARADLPTEQADANLAYLRKMVRASSTSDKVAGLRQTRDATRSAKTAEENQAARAPKVAHARIAAPKPQRRRSSPSDWTVTVAQEDGRRR